MKVEDYINAAIKYGEATQEGDNKVVNKNYKLIDSIFRKLKTENRLSELVLLMDHVNEDVKMWAATHLLVFDEQKAKQVLSEIAKDTTSLNAYEAEMTLKEWEKGNLTYLVE